MKKITLSFLGACLLSLVSMSSYAQPTTSAPVPPARSAAKVISIFSDAYTNVAGTEFNPNWGQSTVVSTIQIGTDNVLKYQNLNYQGTQLSGSVNAISMNKLHIDLWTADGTTFQITPISPGPKEKLITLTPYVKNQWNSYDINLSDFTGVGMSEVFQFKIVGDGTVYIDNLYFYDSSATVDTEAPKAFTVTTGTVASDAVELLLTATDNSGGVNYAITYGSTPVTVNTSGLSGVTKSYVVNGLQPATAYTFSVKATDVTGNAAANNPVVVNATTLQALSPAPVPTLDPTKVISIYSDTYTNVAGTNFYPGWGQSTVASEVSLNGNKTMKYSGFNYQGIELGSHVDASGMNKLHVDIYPTTETTVRLTPISPGHESPTSLGTLTANQWNSFNIPLTTYTGVVMSDIFQFKLDGGTGKVFYMDNLYFFNDVTNGVNDPDNASIKCYLDMNGYLTVSSPVELNSVVIRNVTGQTVRYAGVGENLNAIDMNNVAKGNYLITVNTVDGKSLTTKIIKTK
jgi:hypothetical protein